VLEMWHDVFLGQVDECRELVRGVRSGGEMTADRLPGRLGDRVAFVGVHGIPGGLH
jgi:hypothetical protein